MHPKVLLCGVLFQRISRACPLREASIYNALKNPASATPPATARGRRPRLLLSPSLSLSLSLSPYNYTTTRINCLTTPLSDTVHRQRAAQTAQTK